MIKLNIYEIKTNLSKYIEMVERGETLVVCKRNVPVAEIRPIEKKKKQKPVLGSAAGMGRIPPSFHEPMSEEDLRLWEGGDAHDPLREFAPKHKGRRK